MMSTQTWLTFIFLILTYLSGFVTAQNYGCFGNVNYTGNSTFNNNLNTLLSSLSSNMNDSGFYSASEGQNPDRVYATALCRSDFQLDICRSCVQNATTELIGLCPNRKQGVLFKYICTLRYSDEFILGKMSAGYIIWVKDQSTVSSPDQFNENLRTLLGDLRGQAALSGSLMKIAAGNHTAPDFQTIFALLQCTPDISPDDCTACLISAAQYICCQNSTRVIVYLPSCTLEYYVQLFYNKTRIEEVRAMESVPVPVPVPAPVPPMPSPPGNDKDYKSRRTTIIIVVLVIVCSALAACLGIFLRKRSKKNSQEIIASDQDDNEISPAESLLYDFGKIRAATNHFADTNKLGEGGFGAVYKGKLQNGQEIAVKRLSKNSGQGDLEFTNEVLLMAKLQHKNLVRLLGFSLEGTERLLVYEFVQNASLDRFIFDPIKRLLIDWESRYKIIRGVAKGLLYLHEDSRFRIIHRDLKASNILLDGDMNPKIADFGMAKLFVQDQSGGNTSRIAGTYGYMAPEYARRGQFSVKLDVFSFGVLVLEIVSGQQSNSFRNEENGENIEYMLTFAWRNWHEGTTKKLIDPILRSTSGSLHDMIRCIHIGLLCVQENAIDRPTMASVVVMLNSFSVTLPMPSKPAFYAPSRSVPGTSREMETNFGVSSESKNDASITELYPR